MAEVVVLKQGDIGVSIPATFEDAAGAAVNLTGASVKFLMMDWDRVVKIDAAATITDALNGKVRYDPVAADVDTPGGWRAEFEATLSSGKKISAPNNGYIHVLITPEIA